jgi:hypothetical protein
LTTVIYGSTFMTYAARYGTGACQTPQSRVWVAAARTFGFGSGRAARWRRLDLATPGASLCRTSAANEISRCGGGSQDRIHGEVAAGVGGAPSPLRRNNRRDTQRNRQPRLVGRAPARGRAWLTAEPQLAMKFEWRIARIACCRKNLPKPISCSCRSASRRPPGV